MCCGSLPDGVGAKILAHNSKDSKSSAPPITSQYVLEYGVELVVLRLPLKKFRPPVEDERNCYDEPGKRELGADLRILKATIYVPGVIDVVCAVLVRLRGTHVKNEQVLLKQDEVNF